MRCNVRLLSLMALLCPRFALAVEPHNWFNFTTADDPRPGFQDTATVMARCQALMKGLSACPLDERDVEQVLWCDYAAGPGANARIPSATLELPAEQPAAPSPCTTPLKSDISDWKVPAYYTSVRVTTTTGTTTEHRAGETVNITGVKRVVFTLPNDEFDGEDVALGGLGADAGLGFAAFLRERAGVEVVTFLAEEVFTRVCRELPAPDGRIRPKNLVPLSCEARPGWARTGVMELATLRADILAFPRHLGEELLWVSATGKEGSSSDGLEDGGVTLAVSGRILELVVEGESPPEAAGAWARANAAQFPGGEGEARLNWKVHPVASSLYMTSLLVATLPPFELKLEKSGGFSYTVPAVNNATVVSLLGLTADTGALPDGTPSIPALSGASAVPLQAVAGLASTVAHDLVGLTNAQRSFGTDAVPGTIDALTDVTKGVTAIFGVGGLTEADTTGIPSLTEVAEAVAAAKTGVDPDQIAALFDWAVARIGSEHAVIEPMRRAVVLGASALSADSPEKMQTAIAKAANPPGGWRGKRIPDASPFHWTLVNGYVGAGGGAYVQGGTTDAWFVPTALVGPEVGLHTELGPIKSVGIQAVLLDLGNLGAVPLTDVPTSDTFSFADIATPGLALNIGIGRSPFTISVPVQYTLGNTPGVRVSGALTVDLVLFP